MAVYERTTFGDVRLFISSKTSVASSLHCCLDSLVSLSLPFESCFLFCFCFSNERQEGEGILQHTERPDGPRRYPGAWPLPSRRRGTRAAGAAVSRPRLRCVCGLANRAVGAFLPSSEGPFLLDIPEFFFEIFSFRFFFFFFFFDFKVEFVVATQ